MIVHKTGVSLTEFEQFIMRTENIDRLFELINGEIVEVAPARTRNSRFGLIVAGSVYRFCEDHQLPFDASGADGTYDIQGNIVAPDFAFKHTPMSDDYPDPDPPLWAVEVISPTDKATEIRKKREIYQRAEILLWEMYPQSQIVDVYAPGKPLKTLGIDATLDGGDVLPGFTLSVKKLFAD